MDDEDEVASPTLFKRRRLKSSNSSPNLLQGLNDNEGSLNMCNTSSNNEPKGLEECFSPGDCCTGDLEESKDSLELVAKVADSAKSTAASVLTSQFQPRSKNPLDDFIVLETLFKSHLSPTEVTLV